MNAPSAARQFCTFRLGDRLCGVDILEVREVNRETTFTPVPHAPPEVRGFVNLRGHIHLVLDLRRLLGLEAAVVGPDSRLVIFKPQVGEAFGVLVDAIADIVEVPADAIEHWQGDVPEATLRSGGELIAGVARLAGDLLVILHGRRLLPAVESRLRG